MKMVVVAVAFNVALRSSLPDYRAALVLFVVQSVFSLGCSQKDCWLRSVSDGFVD